MGAYQLRLIAALTAEAFLLQILLYAFRPARSIYQRFYIYFKALACALLAAAALAGLLFDPEASLITWLAVAGILVWTIGLFSFKQPLRAGGPRF